MKEIFAQWQTRLDAFNQRERLLAMLSILAATGFLLHLIMVAPFAKDRQRLAMQASELNLKLSQATTQQQALQSVVSGVQQSPLMMRKQQLEQLIQQREAQLNKSVNTLISPVAMAQVLESVLAKNNNLQLIRLENLPVKPLLTAAAGQEKNSADAHSSTSNNNAVSKMTEAALYQHAFIIELRGNYSALNTYIDALSKLPWHFYWDELDYRVDVYPQAVIKIKVHTVSLAEEWIRV